MTRATIYKIQEPANKEIGNTFVPTPASPLEQIGDGICEVIEDITYGIREAVYRVCDFIDDLALSISSAGYE